MKNFVTPKVYFIGCTAVDLWALTTYLQDTGQIAFIQQIEEAKSQGINDGEILCSFYAKACYSSLTTDKNKNITKVRDIEDNLKGILSSGHGCYDEETEVLTRNGWKNWPEITKSDELATRTKDGALEYHTPSHLVRFHHTGKMYRVESNQVDLLVTPGHNMLACRTSTKEGRKRKVFMLETAENLGECAHAYVKSIDIPFNGNGDSSYDDGRLIGFSIGDGYITGNKIKFHLRRMRKITFLKEICENQKWNLDIDLSNDRYSITIPEHLSEIIPLIYNENKEKQIPDAVLSWNQEALRGVFCGLLNSDGSQSDTGDVYDTTSEKLAGQIQHLALLIGFAANISQAECYKNRDSSFGDKPIYRLSFPLRCLKPEVNRHVGQLGRTYWLNDWSGDVFCAEVPNNTLYVRRNGKPVWSGNSVIEHCNLNFMITNLSRVATHEIVRHRAGFAFSQTSGRYVRTDVLNVVIDPILHTAYDLVEECRQYLEKWYKEMECRLKIDEVKDFATKKKLTSAMRRMLPNGQANEIGVSVNLRALRHTIEMRTGRHAEWEIRAIFNQIYDLVRSKYPVMFSDAREENVDDLKEITFENKKI